MSMPTPEELIKAGAHIGHAKSKWNPKMEPFIFGVRNNFIIIDVFKTIDQLKKAIDFLREKIAQGGKVLFVGSKIQIRKIVKETAENLNMPYVSGRWLGGLFTNFKIMHERIRRFSELEAKREAGELERYTKKERLNIDRELAKLRRELGGIKDLEKIPDALFVAGAGAEKTAVAEAVKMKIPIVAIIDTDADPSAIAWPIPANDSSPKSLELILSVVSQELKGIKPATAEEPAVAKKPESRIPSRQAEKPAPAAKEAARTIIASREQLKDHGLER